jgi:hypothetical protein
MFATGVAVARLVAEADLLPIVRRFISYYLFLTREQYFEESLSAIILEASALSMDVCTECWRVLRAWGVWLIGASRWVARRKSSQQS